MSRVNTSAPQRTAGGAGAIAAKLTPEQELRRLSAACLLWEDTFYDNGVALAGRIKELVPQCKPAFVAECAKEMRSAQHLRHAPLMLVREMARHDSHKRLVGKLLPQVIQRADELAEFVAIYWKEGRAPLSKQVKNGLAAAFHNFNEYELAKYDRAGPVRLRDVLFLCHAKPANKEQEDMWKRLIDGKLETPDTWETALSAGADKAETFTRLMDQGKLGALAFLRNLRNMEQAGVRTDDIIAYGERVNLQRILPFRFVAAERHVHNDALKVMLNDMLLRGCAQRPKLPGKTVVIVDVSGSMSYGNVSSKSELTRLDAAGALAAILRESCEDAVLFATAGKDHSHAHATMEVPPIRGMELVNKFTDNGFAHQIGGGGIFLAQVMDYTWKLVGQADRVVVLTDEQDCDHKANPKTARTWGGFNYLLNVSNHKNGIGYGDGWVHIDGWSEACIDYMIAFEMQERERMAA